MSSLRVAALLLGLGRIAIAAPLIARPSIARLWIGRDAVGDGGQTLTRGFAGRRLWPHDGHCLANGQKSTILSEHWAPKVVAQMNDYQFKLVKIQGEFVWHSHADTDDVFIVLDGEMSIELRDGRVDLKAGEMFVVPKGVEHKPVAAGECQLLLVEPVGTINTGDAGGEMTAADNVWI